MNNSEIENHPLLTDRTRILCEIMNTHSTERGERFAMLDFAHISMRATARDFATVTGYAAAEVDAESKLHQAAILYVYEALKASTNSLIKDWPHRDDMLRNLIILAGEV